jgi:hypothetical protein
MKIFTKLKIIYLVPKLPNYYNISLQGNIQFNDHLPFLLVKKKIALRCWKEDFKDCIFKQKKKHDQNKVLLKPKLLKYYGISLHGNFQFKIHLPFLLVKIKHCIEMLKGKFYGLHIQKEKKTQSK